MPGQYLYAPIMKKSFPQVAQNKYLPIRWGKNIRDALRVLDVVHPNQVFCSPSFPHLLNWLRHDAQSWGNPGNYFSVSLQSTAFDILITVKLYVLWRINLVNCMSSVLQFCLLKRNRNKLLMIFFKNTSDNIMLRFCSHLVNPNNVMSLPAAIFVWNRTRGTESTFSKCHRQIFFTLLIERTRCRFCKYAQYCGKCFKITVFLFLPSKLQKKLPFRNKILKGRATRSCQVGRRHTSRQVDTFDGQYNF